MDRRLRCAILLSAMLSAMLVAACDDHGDNTGSTSESSTGGSGTGGGGAGDSGGGGTGGHPGTGGSTGGGTGAVGGAGGGSGDAVSQCEQMAEAISALCPGDVDRSCMFKHYATLCATERADVLLAGLQCIAANSGAGGCRTFSDPSGAKACIEAAFAQFDTTKAKEAAGHAIPACGDGAVDGLVNRGEPPLATLTDASLDALAACFDTAAQCSQVWDCFDQPFWADSGCFN